MDDAKRAALGRYFDADFYARRHAGALGSLPPLEHYLRFGLEANHRPSLRFDPAYYLERYGDVRRRGYPAMRHFLDAGLAEKRFATQAEELDKLGLLATAAARRLFAETGSGRAPEAEALRDCVEAALDPAGAAPGAWENRFDAGYYLAQHPDVAKSARHPLLHYLKAGQNERRRTSLDVLAEMTAGAAAYRPERKTCLLFLHETTRTGAPVVALEVARALARDFNLVTISRTGGVLEEDFAALSVAVTLKCRSVPDAHVFTRACVRRYDVAFAILNSVEATAPLPALLASGVAAVSLIHEYAQYTLPREKLHQAVLLSDHLVFSSRHVLETWAAEMRDAFGTDFRHRSILHQPAVPGTLAAAPGLGGESRAQLAARHELPLDGRLLVMGGGSVQMRKGFELFLQTAKAARGMLADGAAPAGGRRPFFLWIGKGLDTQDRTFGLWLREEVGRMPADLFAWLPPDPDFHAFVAAADIFFIASRLDPFPNVAIDALLLGSLPMFFDDTTGFQEFVEERGLPHLKARHLDAYDAARTILAHDPARLHGDAAKARALTDFRVEPYVGEIRRLAEAAAARGLAAEGDALPASGLPALPFAGAYMGREDDPRLRARFRLKLVHGGIGLDSFPSAE